MLQRSLTASQRRSILSGLAIAVVVAVMPTTASAEVWIDEENRGEIYFNNDTVGTAKVEWGKIGGQLVNGYNSGTGIITTAEVFLGGRLFNGRGVYGNDGGTGYITTANVYGNGIFNSGWSYLDNGHSGGIGYIDTANVDGGSETFSNGTLRNGAGGGSIGYITTANIKNRGNLINGFGNAGTNGGNNEFGGVGTGYITTANVESGGSLTNGSGIGIGYITTANVESSGGLGNGINLGTGHITTANVNGGGLTNGQSGGTGTITTANVHGGTLRNGRADYRDSRDSTGYITTLNLYGGTLGNGSNIPTYYSNGGIGIGYIDTANVYGGILYNSTSGYESIIYGCIGIGNITTAFLNGGTISNDRDGWIGELIYTSGTYRGRGGVIGTLTVAGKLVGEDWGSVEKLGFDKNRAGVVSVVAVANDGMAEKLMAEAASIVTLKSGATATVVDFAYGNIVLDLTAFGSGGGVGEDWVASFVELFGESFSFAAMFGAAEVMGVKELNSFQVDWGGEQFMIVENGLCADGWYLTNTGLSRVPEPASLAVLGVGVAMMLRRRRGGR